MNYCPECGYEVYEAESFCPTCGQDMSKGELVSRDYEPVKNKAKSVYQSNVFRVIALFVLAITVILFFTSRSENIQEDMHASVNYTGAQIVIRNNNSYDYIYPRLEINNTYSVTVPRIKSGEAYKIEVMQFADKKGNRFSLVQKPKYFSIWSDEGHITLQLP